MTPVGNPFGGAPSGAPSASSSAEPMFGVGGPSPSSPFGQAQPQPQQQQPQLFQPQQHQQQTSMSTAFGTPSFAPSPSPSPSPFGNPSAAATNTTTPAFGASFFGQAAKAASHLAPAFGQPSQNQARQPSPGPIANPFAPLPKPQEQQLVSSTTAAPATSSPFGIFQNSLSDSAQIGVTKPNPFEALKNNAATRSTSPAFTQQQSGAPKPATNPFDVFKNQNQQRQPSPARSFGGPKKAVHFADEVQTINITPQNASFSPATVTTNTPTVFPATKKMGQQDRFAPQPSEGTGMLSSVAVNYANKVNSQLRSDGITAPKWPSSDPGNPAQRPAMEKLKEQYKKYRARAYDSLRKAEIIDHPDHKRRLEDALTFKGICEDMCPDYEQVTRICEYDVKKEEKRPAPGGGEPWPEPTKMVKKFARSAAGIEEPLPMDVRSFDALKRSTDYLLGDLLKTDDQLSALHGYLWDRTRAVRKDFSFHSQKSSDEMQVMVYILETIARFHVVSLHLLSRKGVASDDFDQQQEVQQLGATLLSLNETYDDCRPRDLVCENEGEFRALYLLLNMHDTNVVEKSLEWASQPWYESTHMENAKSLLASLQSFDQVTGPFTPRSLGSHFAASAFTKFFDLVGSKTVSYTMACTCEIHFTWVRQRILATLVKGFARRRDWPKDITPRILNRMLRFDTDEEAVEFVKLHEFEFDTRRVDGRQEQFLLLKSKRQHVPSPRVQQSHSATLVEAKRNGQPLTQVFRKAIYGEKDIEFDDGHPEMSHVLPSDSAVDTAVDSDDGDDMFVGQSSSQKTVQPAAPVNGKQPEVKQTAPAFGAPSGSPFAPKTTPFAPKINPFGATASPFGTNTSSTAAKPSPFAPSKPASNVFQPSNGVSQNGTATTTPPAAQPAAPAKSSFMEGSGNPAINPFGPSKPTNYQPPTVENAVSSPTADETSLAKELGSSPFSKFGGVPKQTPAAASAASVLADANKTPAHFQGTTNGSGQTSTPTATTPSAPNKAASILDGKTPQSSFFSSLTSEKSTTPRSGTSFPTFTPAVPTSSSSSSAAQKPAAASTTPATSILSAAGSVDTNKSTTAAPSTEASSFFSKPPVATSTKPAAASQPKPSQSQSGSSTSQNVPPPAKTTAATPAPLSTDRAPPQQQSDLMADFTKWIVKGDGGLLEEYTEFVVENLLADAFAQHQREEAARIAKEEDDASWAAAREHMAYRLSVKFFYRWREAARQLGMRRILRDGKAKYKAHMEEKAKAERDKAKAEERRKRDEIAQREERMRNNTAANELVAIIAENQKSRQSSAEEALLASGVFGGLRDEGRVARRVVQEARLPRRPESRESSVSMAPPPKPVIETPVKKEGWKTRSIREKFGMGVSQRRDSFNSSTGSAGNDNFSQSLPVGGRVISGPNKLRKQPKVSNFTAAAAESSASRKRSAGTSEDDEPHSAKKNKILKSGLDLHWELRRRGLVEMPDGTWLPSTLANQMFEGKRFEGYGNCGLGPGKPTVDRDDENSRSSSRSNSMIVDATDAAILAGHKPSRSARVIKKITPPPDRMSKVAKLSKSKLEALSKRFGFPPTKSYRRDSSASTLSYREALSRPVSRSSLAEHNTNNNSLSSGGEKRKRTADDEPDSSPTAKKVHLTPDDSSSSDSEGESDGEDGKKHGKVRKWIRKDATKKTSEKKTSARAVQRAIDKIRKDVGQLKEDMDFLEKEETPWMREQIAKWKGSNKLSGGVRDENGGL